MSFVPFSLFDADSFIPYSDLESLPPHRHLKHNVLTEILHRSINFDFVSIGGLDLDGFRFGTAKSIDTTMPPLMLETYLAEGLETVDPMVVGGSVARAALTEEEASDRFGMSNKVSDLMRRFGVRNRILFPIARSDEVYGCAIFARSTPFTQNETQFLSFISKHFHSAITKPIMERYAAQYLQLTAGELACLQLASHGLTSEDIAQRSGYEVRTVDTYIRSATRKLAAGNRVEAVSEALRRGLIS